MPTLERVLSPPEALENGRTADLLVLKRSSLAALERLLSVTQKVVLNPQSTDSPAALWARFGCLLVAGVGFAGTDAIESLASLRVRDLLPITARNYLHLPRLAHTIPVAVDAVTRLAGLQLLAHTTGPGRKGLHSRTLPLLDATIFGVLDLDDGMNLFASWLWRSCEELELDPMSAHRFITLAALRAARRYSPPVAGYLTGALVHRPASLEDAAERLAALRGYDFSEEGQLPGQDLPWIDSPSQGWTGSAKNASTAIDNGIRELRRLTRSFRGRAAAELDPVARRRTRQSLEAYTDWLVAESRLSADAFWERYWESPGGTLPSREIERGNLAIAAAYLVNRTGKSGHTLKGDLAAITRLLTAFGEEPLHRMSASKLNALQLTLPSPSARARHISAVNQLRNFLQERCPGEVCFPHVRPGRRLDSGRGEVLEPYKIAAACRALAARGEEGQAAKLALLLGAFGGLRLGETVRLRLKDVSWSTDHEIVLYLARPKRRGHRWAHLIAVPPAVYAELRSAWEKRRVISKPDDPLLVGTDGAQVAVTTLGRRITVALREIGVRASHRAARTFWTNRLLALGYSLPEIGHLAGHSSLQTTVGSYVHILPWLQQEELRVMGEDVGSVRVGRLGVMLGFSNRAVRREHLEKVGIPVGPLPRQSRFYSVTVTDACNYLGACLL